MPDLLGNHAGHGEQTALAIRQLDAAGKEFLAHGTGGFLAPRGQEEFNHTQRFARADFRPAFAALGKAAIVFGTDHPVGRRFQGMGSLHHPENVGFPIGDRDQTGARHPGRGFGHPLVAFYPADALQDSWTASVCLLEFPCPDPAIHHAQRLPADSDGVGGMQEHATLSLKTEWPQSLDALTVEVEFGRVLQAQDHPMLAHAGDGAFQVRRQDVLPPEALLLLAGLIEKER